MPVNPTLPTVSTDPPDVWGATINTAINAVAAGVNAEETARAAADAALSVDLDTEVERATLAEQGNAALIASTAAHVVYGTGPVPASRPTGYALVIFRGVADPAAIALEGDEWVGP